MKERDLGLFIAQAFIVLHYASDQASKLIYHTFELLQKESFSLRILLVNILLESY